MTHSFSKLLLPILALAALAIATPAAAGRGPCVREAKQDAKECVAECKESFQTAKDTCLNREHGCVEICRANRAQCRLDSGVDAAIDACNDILEARRAECREKPVEERDGCIDRAQVDAFECRDAVRESARPLLKQCRKDFRNCAKACPPPDGGTPPVDPKQCVKDAVDAKKLCFAGCKEQFQVAKDDCRHRDHECMETCRGERHTCRQPVRDDLAAAFAVCAANRQSGFDDCEAAYPPPRDAQDLIDLDQCKDGEQVEAFICRDDAHEAVRPRFAQCRAAFRTCVDRCTIIP